MSEKSGGMNPALKVILIVIAILMVLGCGVVVIGSVLVGRSVDKVGREATRMATKLQMEHIADAITAYRMKNDELPPALANLVGEFIDSNTVPRDAWDNAFEYVRGDDGYTYELISYGADGVEGGEGDDADIRLE